MPAQRIPKEKRALILAALVEGAAVNSICRMFRVGKPNVLRFLCEAGKACEDWHNRNFRGLRVDRIEADEQWSYCHTHKERMSKMEKDDAPWKGDAWLWVGLDPDSKAIISWLTGKRTAQAARTFCQDLAARVPGTIQITSDPLAAYKFALMEAFGERLNYATETKQFASSKVPSHEWPKYRVDPLVGVERESVIGKPHLPSATVSHAERYFLTVRQSNKRNARKTLAYSKRCPLTEADVMLSMTQKGVDMRIGIDVATLALKGHVDRIILISGDMDMIPAMKLARREGVQVVIVELDGRRVSPEMVEDADFLRRITAVP